MRERIETGEWKIMVSWEERDGKDVSRWTEWATASPHLYVFKEVSIDRLLTRLLK
jgi:hypothetical protein